MENFTTVQTPAQQEARETECLQWMQDHGFAIAEEYRQMGEDMYND